MRALLTLLLLISLAGSAASAAEEKRPYDDKLLRIAEILGSIHYLRELCGANDGPVWRNEMQALVESEGSTVLRKARLVASFNKGYRSFLRTYQACTASAETAILRFLAEGAEITTKLVEKKPVPAAEPAPTP